MTNQHPITPPAELVRRWTSLSNEMEGNEVWMQMATSAAQWGANQELEACCEWVSQRARHVGEVLRAARRPKPPSLKEQALKALDHILKNSATDLGASTIRRALEQLND